MISIAAILKNEQPYILEWLAYHMAIGINDFYIADNISTDGSSELLCQLDKLKIITRIEHPTENNTPPQLSAYNKILSIVDKEKWVAFIDADEFIHLSNFEEGLDKIKDLLQDESNGAISLNWAVYGSSHSILPDDGLVIERFTKRAVEEHPVNKHYKSIVRVRDVIGTGLTPHAFKINAEKKFIMPNGQKQEKVDGISDIVDWTGIRLNHYVIKSRAEFINKKSARGRATTMKESLGRNITFFKNHDLNNIEQALPLWLIRKVKNKIAEIKTNLKASGYILPNDEISEPFYRTASIMGRGVIDVLIKEKNKITLKGWATENSKAPLNNIVVVINNKLLVHPISTTLYDRPDVQRAGISDQLKCGFESCIVLPDIIISEIQIYAVNISGLAFVEFNLNAHAEKLWPANK